MRDLFGKEIKVREPWQPFYCIACAATYSAKCKRCGARHCGNKHCQFHECEECGRMEVEQQRSNT